jgi:hypothetical protein
MRVLEAFESREGRVEKVLVMLSSMGMVWYGLVWFG